MMEPIEQRALMALNQAKEIITKNNIQLDIALDALYQI